MIQRSRSYFASRWRVVPESNEDGSFALLTSGCRQQRSGPCVRPSRYLTLTASLTWLLSIFSVF